MRILVTGGLGFLGSRVVRRLAAGGHDVRVLDNGFRGRGELDVEVDLREADIRDARAVREACAGIETVVHLAAVQGTGNFYAIPDVVLDVNLRGVLNVAEACAEEGVRRLFFSSSSEAYGVPSRFPTPEDDPLVVPDVLNPRYSYGGSKIAGELVAVNYARRIGFEYTIVRYHNVYGPGMGWDHVIPQFIRRLELGETFTIQGDGAQSRSFCFVDDAVDCTIAAVLEAAAADQILNIGNPGEEHTINELVELLSELSGKPIDPVHLPFEGEGTRRRVPDVGRARELLGWEPKVPFREGLATTYTWYARAIAEELEEAR